MHVRVGQRAQRGVLIAALVLCSIGLAACGRTDPSDGIRVAWTIDPSPPLVGEPIVALLSLHDSNQKPITGARLRLEGVMSHPGMAPVTAAVVERGEGVYEAALRFTMGGDWILVVSGTLPDGMAFKKQIEINGVRQIHSA